ncbi:hypothetical protein [Actinomadura oligospora]|uniref:hypothetical protein n=1 Tax=Actinomadura oligospora TaxID=111804 RepID=UPI00047E22DB|nr:hypothetical protein [Actinomadura oligospora]
MRLELDMDMSLEEVAEIFEEQGWLYGGPNVFGVPTGKDLAAQVSLLASDAESGDLDYVHSGRIALVRDPDVAGVYQALLTIGYVYVDGLEHVSEEC